MNPEFDCSISNINPYLSDLKDDSYVCDEEREREKQLNE